jgi:hypothetical protein
MIVVNGWSWYDFWLMDEVGMIVGNGWIGLLMGEVGIIVG